MPKINVYVPAWLAEALKESAVPVSAVCQQALEEAVLSTSHTNADGAHRSRAFDRALTNRARTVLRATAAPSRAPAVAPGLRLLRALADEGGNLALVVLGSLGIDGSHLRIAVDVKASRRAVGVGHGLEWLQQRAAAAAADLGDSHVGCEHLLLALVDDPDEPAARFLTDAGANPDRVRQATRTAAAAAAFARSKPAPTAVADAFSAAIDDLRVRLGRLERR